MAKISIKIKFKKITNVHEFFFNQNEKKNNKKYTKNQNKQKTNKISIKMKKKKKLH